MSLRLLNLSTKKLCDTENVSRNEKSLKREADHSQDYSCFVATVTASNLRRDIMVMLLPYISPNCYKLVLI